jgi:hypothetical protein
MSQAMSLAFSIGKDKRTDISNSPGKKFVPGPGTHNPTFNLTGHHEPKWVIGTSQR